VRADLGRGRGRRRRGGFEVEALLVSDSSEPLELELAAPPRVVRDKDGAARYLVTLAPSDLAAGRYRPRLDFKGPVSGDTARSETPVRVE
jgi:hypothetical protein